MLFFKIFTILFPIFAIVTVGYLYAYFRSVDMRTANQFNIEIFTPALIFSALSGKNIDITDYYHLIIGSVVIILGSGIILLPLVHWLRYQPRTFIPPMMFLNTANMGIPLTIFSFGEKALPIAIILLIVGTLFQFTLGMYLIGRQTSGWSLLRSPIMLATLVGLVVSLTALKLPPFLLKPIDMLGQIAIPLMLLSLGARLSDVDLAYWRIGLLGAILRPLSGISIFLLIYPWLTLTPLQTGVLLTFSALPPAVVNYVIAENFQQEPHKVAAIVMLGNTMSFISLPIVLAFALPLANV